MQLVMEIPQDPLSVEIAWTKTPPFSSLSSTTFALEEMTRNRLPLIAVKHPPSSRLTWVTAIDWAPNY